MYFWLRYDIISVFNIQRFLFNVQCSSGSYQMKLLSLGDDLIHSMRRWTTKKRHTNLHQNKKKMNDDNSKKKLIYDIRWNSVCLKKGAITVCLFSNFLYSLRSVKAAFWQVCISGKWSHMHVNALNIEHTNARISIIERIETKFIQFWRKASQ